MLRRLLMWLGMRPAWAVNLKVRKSSDGFFIRFNMVARRWATEEDINVARVEYLYKICHEHNCHLVRDTLD